ncbi:MAG: PEP-utilizing enzyme [Actinomycetota bacterium]
MQLPDPIVELSADGADLDPRRHGAKAVGLQRLMRLGLPVPAGVVIPEASARVLAADPARARSALHDAHTAIGAPARVAVRSGAAVSLPGALETRLDVVFDDVGPAVAAVVASAGSDRARTVASALGHGGVPGTAVVVQRMVDAAADDASGAGAATSCDPITGRPGAVGSFVWNRHGDAVMSGTVAPAALDGVEARLPQVYAQLVDALARLVDYIGSEVEAEFAVERGELWFLQLRTFAIAAIDDPPPPRGLREIARGVAAAGGTAHGRMYTDVDDALDAADRGEAVVLVRPTTAPGDVAAMVRSAAIVTAHGSRESHAAVVARSLGIPAVVGVGALAFAAGDAVFAGRRITTGEGLVVDGTAGSILVPPSDR